MKNNILLILFAISLLSIWSCTEETASPRGEWGYNYFPLEVGKVWNYEMDSIVLRQEIGGVQYDSVHLLVRETLVDTLRDLENHLWYRGERYDRHSDTLPWRFSQTFLLRKDEQRAFRKEDNLEFVKMTFPVEQFRNWDGNVAFDPFRLIEVAGQPIAIYKDWDYNYVYTDEKETIQDISYDSLCLISGVNTGVNDEHPDIEGLATELFERRFSIEKYASGIGLVYREMEILNDLDTCSNWFDHPNTAINQSWCITPWREKAESGFIIRQWLVE